MKTIASALLLTALFSATAKGQFAFEGGVNLANLALESAGTKIKTKIRPMAMIGAVADLAMSNHVYFEPGLFYKGDGCTILTNPQYKVTINTTTLNLNIEYKTGEKCGNRFLLGAGPYISFINNTSYDETNYLKNKDIGLGLNAGYLKRKHFYLRVSYQFGLTNLLTTGDNKNYVKTSGIGISLGYLMGGCRMKRNGLGTYDHTSHHWRGLRNNGQYRRERNYRHWLNY